MAKPRASLAVVIAIVLLSALCAGGDGIASQKAEAAKPDVSELIAQGKSLLGQRKPHPAWDAFNRATELRGDLPDGHLGIYLADEIVFVDLLQTLIEYYIANMDEWTKSKGASGPEKVGGAIVQEMIEDYFRPLLVEMTDELDQIDGEFSFYLPSYPLFVYHKRLVCDLGGEWDQSDVLIFRGASRWWLGLADLLLSYDLDFDVGHILDIELPPDADIKEVLLAYVNAILDMLNDPDYPNFLYLTDDGLTRLPQAGIEFGLGELEMAQGFASLQAETDPQADDIFGYLDENGNGKWDVDEPHVYPYIGRVSEDQTTFEWAVINVIDLAARSTLDGTEYDTSPDADDPFPLSALNPIFESLGLPPLFPKEMTVDLGKFYREPSREQLHDTVLFIATLLKEFLEGLP